MKLAETVTFGGSGLNRAAELRGDTDKMAKLAQGDSARFILLWRGKVLILQTDTDQTALARLTMNHPVLHSSRPRQIFLGLEDDGAPIFAHDISEWTPAEADLSSLGAFIDQSVQQHPDLPQDHIFAELRANMTRLSPRDAELAATARSLFSWHDSHRFCAKCGSPSDMAMAGWQRNCPSCGAQHFPRTDPVVIMLITKGNQVLMGRSPGWPDGMYSLLAGFMEPGETVEAAVRREVFEESGIRVGQVSYLASQPWAFPSSLMIGCAGEAINTDITIDPKEIEDAQWFSKEDIALSFTGGHPALKPARKGAIAQFLLRNWLADQLD